MRNQPDFSLIHGAEPVTKLNMNALSLDVGGKEVILESPSTNAV